MGLRKTEISLLLAQYRPTSGRRYRALGPQSAEFSSPVLVHIWLRACGSKWLLHTPHPTIFSLAKLTDNTTQCYSPPGQTKEMRGWSPRLALLWFQRAPSHGSAVD